MQQTAGPANIEDPNSGVRGRGTFTGNPANVAADIALLLVGLTGPFVLFALVAATKSGRGGVHGNDNVIFWYMVTQPIEVQPPASGASSALPTTRGAILISLCCRNFHLRCCSATDFKHVFPQTPFQWQSELA